jgi:hypothetical protein
MASLGRIPEEGDSVDFDTHRILVRDVENRRVGRVLVTAVPPDVVLDPALTEHPAPEQPVEEPAERPDDTGGEHREGRAS